MGGHMRSHLAKLPIPPKPQRKQFIRAKSPTPSSSYSSSLNNFSKTYTDVHDKLQTQFMTSSNGEVHSQDSTIQYDKVVNTENEINSNPNNFTRRRSERRRKAIGRAALIDTHQVSSILSNDMIFSQVEEVARCLIMLSRDKWDKGNNNFIHNKLVENHNHDDDDDEEEYELVSNHKSRIRIRTTKSNKHFKCQTCNKMFKSYQALGGHRASHKKIKNQSFENQSNDKDQEESGGSSSVVERKTFECPFCFRLFGSGQALGGHKKVHFSNVTINNISSSPKFTDHNLKIDLNLPAPEELSQVGFSSVPG